MQTASAKFNVIEIVPLYDYSAHLQERKKVVVGLKEVACVCNLCGSRWQATEADMADASHFYRYGAAIQLLCGGCKDTDTITLQPMLAQAKGQHTVVLSDGPPRQVSSES